ncbi:HAMP domain-containing sensor histidine kinase, partial [Azospirillum sp. TSO5]
LEWIEDADEAIFHAFSVAVLVTLGLGVAGGALLSVAFLQRVDAISRTAEAIIAGDLASRIPVRGTGDDLDRLSDTLNRMLGRIADLMEGLRQVSNDIAHDLRTPLARLRQRLERVRATAASTDDYAVAVDAALAETDTLLETFAALLRIAQIEGGARPPVRDPVELHVIVETVVEAFTPSAEEDGKVLVSPRLDPAVVAGDRELLTQMLVNLVENAIRHTPAGTRIEVALAAGPGVARLTIADDGPGVPAEERGRIFRRFYRLERSRTTDGSGLGLSLVKAIADRHEATVSVTDNGPGLRVSLDFNLRDGLSARPAGECPPVTAQHSR